MDRSSRGSRRGEVDPFIVMDVMERARALEAAGRSVIHMEVGQPGTPAPLAARMARAKALMRHPTVAVTDLESRLGTRYTADTITRLKALYPGVTFVWLMGADNLAGFHRWDRWRAIMESVPVGVLARPGAGLRARLSPAAQIYAGHSVGRGENLARMRPPAWVFVNVPMNDASSSEIRARGGWRNGEGGPSAPQEAASGPLPPRIFSDRK